MFKRLQGLSAGIIIGVLIAGVFGGVASAANRSLDAVFNNIKIVVDGTTINPTDASCNTVEPFIVNGTTYLPVRAIATALGKEVYWDGPNYTVYLGNMNGALEHPTLNWEDATHIGQSVGNAKTMTDNYDNRYARACNLIVSNGSIGRFANREFEVLLNMKYSSFKGTIFVENGQSANYAVNFIIQVDGKTVYTSPDIRKDSAPVFVDVDITGGNDFKLITNSVDGCLTLCIGDAGFYQ